MNGTCTDPDRIQNVIPSAQGCEDSLRSGGRWLHLQLTILFLIRFSQQPPMTAVRPQRKVSS
jgi:hypothetical protein